MELGRSRPGMKKTRKGPRRPARVLPRVPRKAESQTQSAPPPGPAPHCDRTLGAAPRVWPPGHSWRRVG
eukprot:2429332-Prymnesium_polylepis.1